jgi:uncharacterized RDD family membrane protein YckC
MERVQIRTAQNVFIDYPLASLGDRIVAYILDALIVLVYVIAAIWTLVMLNVSEEWLIITVFIPAFFYHLFTETLLNGQSIGKMQMKIKVVKMDGSEPTLGSYILRWILRIIDIHMMSGGIAIIAIAAGGKGQRVGDLAAGTTVIKLSPLTQVAGTDVIKVMKDDTYQVTYPGVTLLSDRDIDLVREALRVNREDGNVRPVLMVFGKIKDILQVNPSETPLKFLYTIISDYKHLTSR